MAVVRVRVAQENEYGRTVASGLRRLQSIKFSEGGGIWRSNGNIFHDGFIPLTLVVDDVVGR